MSRQWLRVGALGMAVVLAGCAAAPLKPAVEGLAVESQSPWTSYQILTLSLAIAATPS
jgi:hypothetical protein